MLWLVFASGARPFGPAQADAVLVDLLPLKDAPPEVQQEPPKSEKPPKSEEPQQKPDKPAARNDDKRNAKPDPKPDPKTASDDAEVRAATAARLAWMLNLQPSTEVSLSGPPSDIKSSLTREEILEFKTQVSKCFVPPEDAPRTPGLDFVIRIALRPDGRLALAPELNSAPGVLGWKPLIESAKRALQQCQPYTMLPADKYQDWKVVDLSFTADGPTGLTQHRSSANY